MLKKIVISGDIVEVFEYSQYITGKGGAHRSKEKSQDLEKSLENYANTNQRRRDMVRRLACSNFDTEYDKFFTLTFKDNMTDIKVANRIFSKFIMRLKSRFSNDLKYLAVIEFQDRGAIHYHVLSDIPYIPQKELQDIWGNGFVFINAISHVDNVGAYIVKYMTKDNNDKRLQGQKGFFCSRNLRRPEEYINHDKKEFEKIEKKVENKYHISEREPIYNTLYDTTCLGSCNYSQYNFKRK